MNVVCVPLIIAEKTKPDKDVMLISISEPGEDVNIKFEEWGYPLQLKFHDIDISTGDVRRVMACNENDLVPFSEDIAKQLIDYVLEHKDKVKGIIVHCHAAISRSPAVVKFIKEKILNEDSGKISSLYNRFVFSTLVKTWEKLGK